ncbi:hypothetical protein CSKR_203598 [Clonorchis sinensis]|uniref:Uncharacterized protein n=1 Tax=Clonorchis sinensis TaxID=79923 RepID=A0A8T1MCR7_CLOSI|nr:hypothetical protein CSKR_203598 [Clonorchis sinensis]
MRDIPKGTPSVRSMQGDLFIIQSVSRAPPQRRPSEFHAEDAPPNLDCLRKTNQNQQPTVVKSYSFGERFRLSAVREKGSCSPVKLQCIGHTSSTKSDINRTYKKEDADDGSTGTSASINIWPISYSPLPSPLIDVFVLDFSKPTGEFRITTLPP